MCTDPFLHGVHCAGDPAVLVVVPHSELQLFGRQTSSLQNTQNTHGINTCVVALVRLEKFLYFLNNQGLPKFYLSDLTDEMLLKKAYIGYVL